MGGWVAVGGRAGRGSWRSWSGWIRRWAEATGYSSPAPFWLLRDDEDGAERMTALGSLLLSLSPPLGTDGVSTIAAPVGWRDPMSHYSDADLEALRGSQWMINFYRHYRISRRMERLCHHPR